MNFKHLHYFWATAKAGGVMRAGEQLHITPQTLSGQIKLLEARLGYPLFRKHGRQLELTEEGRVMLGYAEQIFSLSAEMETAIGQARAGGQALDCRVGIADSVPKSIAYRLLAPALDAVPQQVRLICHEGKFQDLLAQLAVQRLDLVMADEAMNKQLSVKAFNHPLGTTATSFFCTAELKKTLKGRFPQQLDGAPMLMPGAGSALRLRLTQWFIDRQLHPRTIGEFDDAALMKAFGREGRGVFTSPTVLEQETCEQYGVKVLGRSDELVEEFYAISVERRITHPAVSAITQAGRRQLFGGAD
ncbi:MAG TPA: transcriptional activator NhaR [Ideonella sp.]|uniref:transcriptional activator NhaR n=1 Tax=Ideonella sp. TaxID=1929293 RepID=UPI002BD5FA5D|nr:transcriptional activator NhaR [Ideonella sp.]HSI47371.1 transcriptional activator NhaR [Ideonella sp.]